MAPNGVQYTSARIIAAFFAVVKAVLYGLKSYFFSKFEENTTLLIVVAFLLACYNLFAACQVLLKQPVRQLWAVIFVAMMISELGFSLYHCGAAILTFDSLLKSNSTDVKIMPTEEAKSKLIAIGAFDGVFHGLYAFTMWIVINASPVVGDAMEESLELGSLQSAEVDDRREGNSMADDELSSIPYNEDEVDPMADAEREERELDEAAQNHELDKYEETDDPRVQFHLKCELNGHEVRGLVDTGATHCHISESAARVFEVDHLIDMRYKATFNGVGGQVRSNGSIRAAEVSETLMFANLTVLADAGLGGEDVVFGMEFLIRYASVIDFQSRTLVFAGVTAHLH